MMRARFWVWELRGWVKITLAPGQSLTLRTFSRDEEGWSRYSVTWTHEGTHVRREHGHDGTDCDGRLSGGGAATCHLSRLQAVEPYRNSPDEFAPPGRPDWEEEQGRSWQRDARAEMAGY